MHGGNLDYLFLAIQVDPFDDLARRAFADELEFLGYTRRASNLRWFLDHPRSHQGIGLPTVFTWLKRQKVPDTGSGFGVMNRGFLWEVRLPLKLFMDSARELFLAHPLISVRLTDRSPGMARGEGGGDGYFWGTISDLGQDMPWVVPVELASKSPGSDYCREVASFADREEASDWLSQKCVDHGRRLAGLPPLDWKVIRAEGSMERAAGR